MKKNKIIEIIQSDYGMTKKEAYNYLKTISEKQKQSIFIGFTENAKKSFFDD